MSEQQNRICPSDESGAEAQTRRFHRGVRNAALLAALGGISLAAGFETARTTLPAPKWDSGLATRRIFTSDLASTDAAA